MNMPDEYRWLLETTDKSGDASQCFKIGIELEEQQNLPAAATALDRGLGLAPHDESIRETRQRVLDQLVVRECGILFRYVPAGSFLMG